MKGNIYAIRSHQTTDIYIGSTKELLCRRMARHRKDYKRWLNKTFCYVSSFDILNYNDAYIELIEEGEFESKQALYAREGHYIRTMDCVNKNIPGRTKLEYRQDNKEKISEKNKRLEILNKDKRKEQKKQYYLDNKEEINKKNEIWRKNNLEHVAQKQRERNAKKNIL